MGGLAVYYSFKMTRHTS